MTRAAAASAAAASAATAAADPSKFTPAMTDMVIQHYNNVSITDLWTSRQPYLFDS